MASDVDEQPPEPAPGPDREGGTPRRRSGGAATADRRRGGRPPRPAAGPPSRRRPPPAPPGPSDPGGPEGKSQKKLVVILSVLTVVVVALAGFAFVLSSGNKKGLPPAAPADIPVTSFTDRQTGATLQYPRSWKQVQVPNATYRLVLDGGNNVGMTFRVFNTDVATTATNLANVKTVTDGIVSSNESVQVLKQQAIQLNGMVGYYYFYTFTDDSGLAAVHAHYFLFQGQKMNMIVFQSGPDDFDRMATIFDKVAESFRSDPKVVLSGVAPVSIPTTTVP
jgi:hypothetical protein